VTTEIKNPDNGGRDITKCPKLRDVIYGRPYSLMTGTRYLLQKFSFDLFS